MQKGNIGLQGIATSSDVTAVRDSELIEEVLQCLQCLRLQIPGHSWTFLDIDGTNGIDGLDGIDDIA